MPYIAIAFLAVVGLGGGLAIEANNALPSDLLYPVKVHVNENIEGAFALTNTARADWDMHMIEARLSEAQQLALAGTLTNDEQTAITNNFDTHTYDLGKIVAKLQADGDASDADAITTKFKAMLQTRESLLASTTAQLTAQTQSSLIPIVAEVHGALGAAAVLLSGVASSSTNTVRGGINLHITH